MILEHDLPRDLSCGTWVLVQGCVTKAIVGNCFGVVCVLVSPKSHNAIFDRQTHNTRNQRENLNCNRIGNDLIANMSSQRNAMQHNNNGCSQKNLTETQFKCPANLIMRSSSPRSKTAPERHHSPSQNDLYKMENGCKCLASLLSREKMSTGKALLTHHLHLLVFGNHLMLQVPTRASAQLSHNNIAITQHVDVEIDM